MAVKNKRGSGKKLIRKTGSVCPECNSIVGAEVFERDGKVWISKECKQHGPWEELYWGSAEMYRKAERFARDGKGIENPNVDKNAPVCPKDCGLCNMHKSHTALANLVLTNRCDLSCWYCFFFAKRLGYVYEPTRQDDGALRQRLCELAAERRRFGYRRLGYLLAREGMKPNHKKLLRIYREEGLRVRRRGGRKRALGTRRPMVLPDGFLRFLAEIYPEMLPAEG